MWKSPDGMAHTVALPDPTSAMTPEFVRSIEALDHDGRSLLLDAVDDFFERLATLLEDIEPREPRSPELDALPDEHLRGTFSSGSSVLSYLDSIDLEWRLDAYLAVSDLIDELETA